MRRYNIIKTKFSAKMHKEQLSPVFLVFVILVISAMVYCIPAKVVCITLLVGIIGAIWTPETQHPHQTPCSYHESPTIEKKSPLYQSKKIAEEQDEDPPTTYGNLKEAERQYSEQDFDVMLYNNLDAVKNVYYDMACPGDNALAERMWEQGRRSQQATINRAKFDKYSLLHYFDEELRSTANSRWWDNDALEHKF